MTHGARMKPNASVPPSDKSAPPCRTCKGLKVIKVQAHKGGGRVEESQTPCPACRGSGTAGYIVK